MEILIAIVSVLGLAGALIYQTYLSYKERKEMRILDKSKDLSEFEFITNNQGDSEEEKPVERLVDIAEMPNLYEKE